MFIRYSAVSRALSAALAGTAACLAAPAAAQDTPGEVQGPVSIEGSYKADVVGVVDGGAAQGARYLDNVNLMASFDLDGLFGWHGTAAYVNVLNNLGGRPNDLAGSIQGVNNIEVANTRLKLYEAWIEQSLSDAVSLRAGLYDLNSEFYQNDSAGLLISPPFGIGSELSATGPNGPSIFPSTALAARIAATWGAGYIKAAVVNARAGTIGDEQGVSLFGDDGALLIGEAGWTGNGKLAVGAWRYTRKQPLIDAPDITLGPADHVSQGLYVAAEHALYAREGGTTVTGFLRGGVSDGHTTPFSGGWQAGVLVERVLVGRPASSFSLGVGSAVLSRSYRDSSLADGTPLMKTETIIEATYRDEILPGLSLQPDIQYVINPSADPSIRNALVLGLRVQFDFRLK